MRPPDAINSYPPHLLRPNPSLGLIPLFYGIKENRRMRPPDADGIVGVLVLFVCIHTLQIEIEQAGVGSLVGL